MKVADKERKMRGGEKETKGEKCDEATEIKRSEEEKRAREEEEVLLSAPRGRNG